MTSNSSIGFFGKLPGFADFVGHNAKAPLIQEMHEWIEQGMACGHAPAENWPQTFACMPPWAFLFCSKRTSQAMAGCMVASHDKSRRAYPFVVFKFLELEMFDQAPWVIPVCMSAFFSQARSFIAKANENSSVDQLVDGVGHIDGPHDPVNGKDYFTKFSLGEFLKDSAATLDAEQKLGMFYNLYQVLAPVRGLNLKKFSLGLQFLLGAHAQQQAEQIAGWYYLVWKFVKQPQTLFSWFWADTCPCLVLHLNTPGSRLLEHLVTPHKESDYVLRLDAEKGMQPEQSKQQIPSQLAGLLDQIHLNLADFASEFACL